MSTPQSDILKSISEQVGGSASRELPLSWILYPAAIVVALILIFSFLNWQKRRAATRPTSLNDPKKLLAELRRQGILTRAELRHLKQRSRQLHTTSPLTIALCPSLKKRRPTPVPA